MKKKKKGNDWSGVIEAARGRGLPIKGLTPDLAGPDKAVQTQKPAPGPLTTERYGNYGNQIIKVDGEEFDSKAEGTRRGQLVMMQRAGEIRDLQFHVRYDFIINGVLVCWYEADFVYVDCRTGKTVVEDKKGHKTRVYRIKNKLMKACHGIDILET